MDPKNQKDEFPHDPHNELLDPETQKPEVPVYVTQYRQMPRARRDYFSVQTEDIY